MSQSGERGGRIEAKFDRIMVKLNELEMYHAKLREQMAAIGMQIHTTANFLQGTIENMLDIKEDMRSVRQELSNHLFELKTEWHNISVTVDDIKRIISVAAREVANKSNPDEVKDDKPDEP